VFILAHRIGSRLEGFTGNGDDSNQPGRVKQEQNRSACASGLCCWPSRPGEQQYGWEPPMVVSSERPLGRDIDGSSGRMDYAELCVAGDNRTDELRLLGNGVVPATAELAYRTLARELFTA
jgi:hypothetical protein